MKSYKLHARFMLVFLTITHNNVTEFYGWVVLDLSTRIDQLSWTARVQRDCRFDMFSLKEHVKNESLWGQCGNNPITIRQGENSAGVWNPSRTDCQHHKSPGCAEMGGTVTSGLRDSQSPTPLQQQACRIMRLIDLNSKIFHFECFRSKNTFSIDPRGLILVKVKTSKGFVPMLVLYW